MAMTLAVNGVLNICMLGNMHAFLSSAEYLNETKSFSKKKNQEYHQCPIVYIHIRLDICWT